MAYEPEWWNRRRGGQGGGGRGIRQRDPVDVIEKLAMWGMEIARKGKQNSEAKFNRFNKMTDVLVGDIHYKLTPDQLDTKEKALTEYYNKMGGKENLDISQVYETYIQRIADQRLENSNYKTQYAKWEEHSNNVDNLIDNSHTYSYLESDEAKASHRNQDKKFTETYLQDPNNASIQNTDAGYKKYIEDSLSSEMDAYGDFQTTFFGEYNHRIPDNTIDEMNDTKWYMTSLLSDWKKDEKIDHHEYEAYYKFIQHGDKERLTQLREVKDRAFAVQADRANESLNVKISEYAEVKKHLDKGNKYIDATEIAEIDKYALDYELGTDDGLYLVRFDDKDMELPDKSNPDHSKLKKQKDIARYFYDKYIGELKILNNDIVEQNNILIDLGVEGSLERYGFKRYTGGMSTKKKQGIDTILGNVGNLND